MKNKHICFCSLLMVFVLMLACGSGKKESAAIDFGIYQVIAVTELPVSIKDTIAGIAGISLTEDGGPFAGYVDVSSPVISFVSVPGQEVKLASTYRPVDDSGRYCGLLVIKNKPGVESADIYKAVPAGYDVELRFTRAGAEKWAEMTAQNTGKFVAFVINGRAYSTPAVMAEIRSGKALITGLENEQTAIELAEFLNGK